MLRLLFLQLMQQSNKLSLALRREAAPNTFTCLPRTRASDQTYTCTYIRFRTCTRMYVCVFVCGFCFLRAHLNF